LLTFFVRWFNIIRNVVTTGVANLNLTISDSYDVTVKVIKLALLFLDYVAPEVTAFGTNSAGIIS
jgi:hypothetical protein